MSKTFDQLESENILLLTALEDISDLVNVANSLLMQKLTQEELKEYVIVVVKKLRKYKDYLNSENPDEDVKKFIEMMNSFEAFINKGDL